MRLPIKPIKKEQYEKYLELIPDFKREKTQKYITIVLTLSAAIILGIFAINPTLSTIANLQKQIDDNNFVQQKLQQKITNLATLQQKYNDLQPDLTVVTEAVPVDSQIPLLMGQLQSIANASNLTITGLRASEAQLTDLGNINYSSFDFNISVTGNYQDMLTFLNQIINFQRAVQVSDIALSTNSTGLGLTLKGTVFFKQ
jgi:Tfp pilus assembly protein PilO